MRFSQGEAVGEVFYVGVVLEGHQFVAAFGNFGFVQPAGKNVLPLHLTIYEQGVERGAEGVGAAKSRGEGDGVLQGVGDLGGGDDAAP